MITLTEEQMRDLADQLASGMKCFVHKKTNEVVYYPDELRGGLGFDEELWIDDITKVEEAFDEYVLVEAMSTRESFDIMERFVETVEDPSLQKRLEKALSRPKPFRNFKYEVDDDEYRQKWFAFRDQENLAWVQRQVQMINDYLAIKKS
jgi:hypothetical protein